MHNGEKCIMEAISFRTDKYELILQGGYHKETYERSCGYENSCTTEETSACWVGEGAIKNLKTKKRKVFKFKGTFFGHRMYHQGLVAKCDRSLEEEFFDIEKDVLTEGRCLIENKDEYISLMCEAIFKSIKAEEEKPNVIIPTIDLPRGNKAIVTLRVADDSLAHSALV